MCVVEGQTYTNTLNTAQQFTCTAGDVLTTAKRTFLIESVLASAKDYFSRALQVESVVGNLVLAQANDQACSTGFKRIHSRT